MLQSYRIPPYLYPPSVSIRMAARINVIQSASRRGGVIYEIEGKSYYCVRGKMQNPIEEHLNQEEVELIDPALLGKPKYTPLYLKCCNCNVRGILKELEDGSYIDLVLHGGKLSNFLHSTKQDHNLRRAYMRFR